MDVNKSESVQWFVVFQNMEKPEYGAPKKEKLIYWFIKKLRPGFQHVCAFREAAEFQGWLKIDSYSCGIAIEEITDPFFLEELEGRVNLGLASVVPVFSSTSDVFMPRAFLTCVSVVKHLLGVKSWAVTPFGLFKFLKRGEKNEY
jgi:hypothetical protein